MFKRLFIFFAVLIIPMVGKSATGCLSDNTIYTYINPMGYNMNGVPAYYHRYESDRRLTASNFCTKTRYPIKRCYIYATRKGYSSSPGTIVDYYTSSRQCNVPLDSELWYLLLPVAGISFLSLRKD